jgi:hypothetical protein
MRNLTVTDGCLDAPFLWMKRVESWLIFIDAEHMADLSASDVLTSDRHNTSASYHFFPTAKVRSPHFAPVSPIAIDRHAQQSQFYDLGMSPAPLAADKPTAHGNSRV